MGDELEKELVSLGEEGLVDLLERRYLDKLYTLRVGSLLYTMNPGEGIETSLDAYLAMGQKDREHHLYSVPDRAIKGIEKISQSIVLFGDSGSG
jgi:myosin heavy subunit